MELNKIYNMDCIEYMKTLPDECIDLIIVDPPYFSTNIKEVGDNQWKTEEEYIEWYIKSIGEFKRILKDSGSLYLFHNNHNIMTDILYECKHKYNLKIRNHITWNKFPTHNNFSRVVKMFGKNRNYGKTFTEDIWFLTKQDDFFETPFSRIMKKKMEELNLTQIDISKLQLSRTGKLTGWVSNKLKGTQIPTKEQWGKICSLFNIDDNYDELTQQFELERYRFNQPYVDFKNKNINEQKELLKPYSTIWEFPKDENIYKLHLTPKPEKMIDNILKISSNENDLVYIPFAGSGSEIVSCIKNNRNYIATELNKSYIDEIIIPRIENMQ